MRPKDPISARELRGSRIALEKIIGKAKGSVWVSLDDLVEFACSNLNCQMIPGAFSIPFGMMVSYNGTTNQGFESGYLRGLQFYGTLGMAQRERLRGGVELAVAQIPPKARGVLDKLFTETGRGNFYMNVEPTSALPDGVTPDLRIKGSISDGTLFRPLPDAGEATGPSRAKTAGDFAREKWIRLHNTEPDRITANEPVRVLIGSRSIWTFDVMDAHQILTTLLVADDRVPNGATPFLMDDLPENIKSELNRAYEQFVKTMGDGG